MHRFFKVFTQAVKKFNLFTSPVTLRYDLDPDYDTFTGGCLTIILFSLFFSIFLPTGIQLLNKNKIQTKTQNIKQDEPTLLKMQTQKFIFALGFQGSNMNNLTQKRYFDVNMNKVQIKNKIKKTTKFQLQACRLQHWQNLGQQFIEVFNKQSLQNFLCPPQSFYMQLNGKYTSTQFIYYKITVDGCTGEYCATQDEIKNYILKNTSFKLNIFYSNILINPQQKQPVTYFLQDKDYLVFSDKIGTHSNIYIGQLQTRTDDSLFPWSQVEQKQAFVINRAQKQSWNYQKLPHQSYTKLFLRKSDYTIKVQRSFLKIDSFLSYIGGLFGLVAMVFGIIMNYYGQCSFELDLCQRIFDYTNTQKKQKQKKQDDAKSNSIMLDENMSKKSENLEKQSEVIQPQQFGIFDFFCHLLYKVIHKIYDVNWKRMEIYHQSVEQMRYKLDVGHIIEKLSFYDRAISALFTQNQLKLLYLQQKFNFNDVRRQRKLFSFKNSVYKTMTNILNTKKDLNSYQQKIQNNQQQQTQQQRARKRIDQFVIGNQFNFISNIIPSKSQLEDVSLPSQIKKALYQLQQSVQKGDLISKRIYNGLQSDLLQAFEKNKLKRQKRLRIRTVSQNKKNNKLKIKSSIDSDRLETERNTKDQNNNSDNQLLDYVIVEQIYLNQ